MEERLKQWLKALKFNESTISMLLGGLVVVVVGVLIYNYFTSDSLELATTVSLALFCVVIFAAVFGTWIPLVLNKYKIDPALATGPFITTANDVFSILLYFYIGFLLYN